MIPSTPNISAYMPDPYLSVFETLAHKWVAPARVYRGRCLVHPDIVLTG
jgi:hypothetical protein